MKIIDKIKRSKEAGKPFYSFEYFPPKTPAGVANLYARIERMGRLHPEFIDVTWGAGGSTAELTLEIVTHTQNLSGIETMMHLTCTNMSRQSLSDALIQARENGIQNILALRGDPPHGQEIWQTHQGGFSQAIDLVRFIREEHGDYFGICVAAYPGGHIDNPSYEQDLIFLKEKIDAGADFVITQLFYDEELFLSFERDCRAIGIECPIIPGIMPVHSYQSFCKVTQLSRDVPPHVFEIIEAVRNDDEAVKAVGFELSMKMCRKLLDAGVPGLHFYTMNLEGLVTGLVEGLELVPEQISRTLPWRRSANEKRSSEDVRPIFWANRPKSYLMRTMQWDEFPNGRWGDSRSPAFGGITPHPWRHVHVPLKLRKKMWGESPQTIDDIIDVFVKFCDGQINAIPWFDAALELESVRIKESLIKLNRSGLLTINSQPRVNAAKSTDPAVGWGGKNGIVYQKSYVEFFVDGSKIPLLLDVFNRFPNISYHAVNGEGVSHSNCDSVNAVTWGVFPGMEIIQPTVVDPDSFMVWKDEAFDLWVSAWGNLYPEGSTSRGLFDTVYNTYFLVNVVDNDFIDGDIWSFFDELIAALHKGEQ